MFPRLFSKSKNITSNAIIDATLKTKGFNQTLLDELTYTQKIQLKNFTDMYKNIDISKYKTSKELFDQIRKNQIDGIKTVGRINPNIQLNKMTNEQIDILYKYMNKGGKIDDYINSEQLFKGIRDSQIELIKPRLGKNFNQEDLSKLDYQAVDIINDFDGPLDNFDNVDDLYKNVLIKTIGIDDININMVNKKPDLNDAETRLGIKKIQEENPSSYKYTAHLVKKNVKTVAVIAVLMGMAIAAEVNRNKINTTNFKIISINNDITKKNIVVYYEPADIKLREDDLIIINESNSDPNINGQYNILKTSIGNLQIKGNVRKPGNSGSFRCVTTFDSQFANQLGNLTQPFQSQAEKILLEAFDTFGNLFKDFWWIFILIFIFLILSITVMYFVRNQ